MKDGNEEDLSLGEVKKGGLCSRVAPRKYFLTLRLAAAGKLLGKLKDPEPLDLVKAVEDSCFTCGVLAKPVNRFGVDALTLIADLEVKLEYNRLCPVSQFN